MIEIILSRYPLLVEAIQCFFCFFLSKRMLGQRIDFKHNWYIPICIMIGCYYMVGYISEPFLTIAGISMTSAFLCLQTKTKPRQMFYAVFIAFMIETAILMSVLPVSGAVVYWLAGYNNDAANLAAFPMFVAINIIICRTGIMKRGFAFLFEKGNRFKPPLLIISVTVLMLYITIHELFDSGIDPTEYISVYLSVAAFFIAIIGFFFHYLYSAMKENNEKSELEKLNKALADEKHDVEKWVKNLKKELKSASPEISAEIASELEELLPPQHNWHKELAFPSTGRAVLDSYLTNCRDAGLPYGIDITVLVRDSLTCIPGKKIKCCAVLSVISNCVDNAFKALEETARKNKKISVEFGINGETNIYEIMISDNAHEFDAGVIKNLGKENNTTNGTGRGFPNTMKTLAGIGACMTVREWEYDDAKDIPTKCIVIHFDKKGESQVESYRFGQFKIIHKEDMAPALTSNNKEREVKLCRKT